MNLLISMSDQQLVQLYISGNAEALSILIMRYKDKIYTSINLLVKDKYLAEDIFQDVFIKVIDTLRGGRYTDEGKFLPWVMRIAHNFCVDHFRNRYGKQNCKRRNPGSNKKNAGSFTGRSA